MSDQTKEHLVDSTVEVSGEDLEELRKSAERPSFANMDVDLSEVEDDSTKAIDRSNLHEIIKQEQRERVDQKTSQNFGILDRRKRLVNLSTPDLRGEDTLERIFNPSTSEHGEATQAVSPDVLAELRSPEQSTLAMGYSEVQSILGGDSLATLDEQIDTRSLLEISGSGISEEEVKARISATFDGPVAFDPSMVAAVVPQPVSNNIFDGLSDASSDALWDDDFPDAASSVEVLPDEPNHTSTEIELKTSSETLDIHDPASIALFSNEVSKIQTEKESVAAPAQSEVIDDIKENDEAGSTLIIKKRSPVSILICIVLLVVLVLSGLAFNGVIG